MAHRLQQFRIWFQSLESLVLSLGKIQLKILQLFRYFANFSLFCLFVSISSDKNAIVYNSQCGHMLRTKLEKSNEGGVAAGSGALDSPYLYDD